MVLVLVCAVTEGLLLRLSLLLMVLLLLLLRMEVVHGGGVGVCLVRLGVDLGVAILRHRLHLGVLGRCGKKVGACLILLVAHICHRVPGSILVLLLVRLLVLVLMLMLLMLLLELLLWKLRLVLLVLRISSLGVHLLIAMAIVGLAMARRLLAPVVHGGICHCAHAADGLSLYSLFHPPVFQCRGHLIVTAVIVGSSVPRGAIAWGEMGRRQGVETHSASRQSRTGRDELQRTSRLKMPIPGQMRLPASWKPRPPRAPDGPCVCTCHRRRGRPPGLTSRGSIGDGDLESEI